MHEISFHPGRVGSAGTTDCESTFGPSVPLNALTSGSGGVEAQPGLGPDVQRGLQPGSRAIGTRLLCAKDSVKTPRSGRHVPVLMNG